MREGTLMVRRLGDISGDDLRRRLSRSASAIFNDEMRAYARGVLDDVARRGDAAVAEYTARWDGVGLAPGEFGVPHEDIRAAADRLDGELLRALAAAIARTRRYNEWLRPQPVVLTELEPGLTVGVRYTPCRSAGIYVPSGKGRFPSTLITLATPAVVAGVDEVVVVVPPRPDGTVDSAVLAAADLLGITRIFRCNGAAGVAALAVGTATIPRTDVITGPGNPVIAAVQQAAAAYGARPLAVLGPSESIVLADEGADAAYLAVDLLNEAEHGADSVAIALITDTGLAERVMELLPGYLARLPEPRRSYATRAITDLGGVFIARDLDEAVAWIDRFAPEHLQLAVRDPLAVAARIHHAGEILLGQATPFAAANYAIGVPAALPTGGAAASSAGITLFSFLKAISMAGLTPEGLRTVAPVAVHLGRYEGFPAHVQAITEREAGAR